ncbi:hypothetical protein HNP89_001172 [Methanococcus maripaludis]|uniref:Uncharacterized protein n=1 Tax=Methanococcus maripaludis TaxID=39152 RepID=A0A7J9PCI0_METMI|nr:hypothetical protein [Methanococcus maripaludis]MBA2860367.1 hypothetical protein [Methanococcus maripaludis]MBA2869169.1 hypothetical protein [Methanococcus maripaludis]
MFGLFCLFVKIRFLFNFIKKLEKYKSVSLDISINTITFVKELLY